jgi:hypothetical protein
MTTGPAPGLVHSMRMCPARKRPETGTRVRSPSLLCFVQQSPDILEYSQVFTPADTHVGTRPISASEPLLRRNWGKSFTGDDR